MYGCVTTTCTMQAPPTVGASPCPPLFAITAAAATSGRTSVALPSSKLHLGLRDRGNAFFLSDITRRSLRQIPQAFSELPLPLDEKQFSDSDESKTVRVKFVLRKECTFGQQLLIVGNIPQLGQWDTTKAINLEWSDGHIWMAELVLPAEEIVHFKFILQSSPGQIEWQPGPDRILRTWETTRMISVFEDWEDAEKQKIEENELLSSMDEVMLAQDKAGADPNAETDEKDDDIDKDVLTEEIEEKKSLLDCSLLAFGQSTDPGFEHGPTVDAETSPGSGVNAYTTSASHFSISDVLKKEEKESQDKVEYGKRKSSSSAAEISEEDSFNAAADYPAEDVMDAKEEWSEDDSATTYKNLHWGRETVGKLFVLAMSFFVRDLS